MKMFKFFVLLNVFLWVLPLGFYAQDSGKIKVLNFGTFHMGYTSDANKTEFDERDEKNRKAVHEIAKKLAEFKPTVLIVERVPEKNEELQKEYAEYLKDPEKIYKNPTEIELLAFELGRLSKASRIYGIVPTHILTKNCNLPSSVVKVSTIEFETTD